MRQGQGQARLAAIVIAVAMAVWLAGQWLGGRLGLDPRYAVLLDLAAAAALIWALVVLIGVLRSRGP